MNTDISKGFISFPELETQNLRLRALVPDDADALFEIFADDDVLRYYDLYPLASL